MNTSRNEELSKLIHSCLKRGNRPIQLPHCAICARYATENLAFEAIMAIVDALPATEAHAVAERVENELHSLPGGYRQQMVTGDNFAALMDAPSWRLVRSLVIDLFDESVKENFADLRLSGLEEITLLGGAYGGPDISPGFLRALVESPSLLRVRKVTLHSGDIDAEGRSIFWSSEFARRLEEIHGFSYLGEELPHPLVAKVIRGLYLCDANADPRRLLSLARSQKSPNLQQLSLSVGSDGTDCAISALEADFEVFARLQQLDLSFWALTSEQRLKLGALSFPSSVNLNWRPETEHNAIFSHGCDTLNVFKADGNDVKVIRESDFVTNYEAALFELDVTPRLSRKLKTLNTIVAPDRSIDDLLHACKQFPLLEGLTVAFPFSIEQVLCFSASPTIRALKKLDLCLSLTAGRRTTDYKDERAEQFFAPITDKEICDLISSGAFRHLDLFTIANDAIEISRSKHEFQHVVLGSSTAAQAFAEIDADLPIELLRINAALEADDFAALARTKVFERVHRLCIEECLTDEAMTALTSDPGLRNVEVLTLSCFHKLSIAAFKIFVDCPFWEQVREFDFSTNVDGATSLFARSDLLPRLVSLGCYESRNSAVIPEGKRLPLLRRIDESLSMTVFTDARQARIWLAADPSTPLRARLRAFIDRTYGVHDSRTAEVIIADLKRLDRKAMGFDECEARVSKGVTAVLAKVFDGQPVPPGTAFGSLTDVQKRALKAVEKIGKDWWNVGDVMRCPLASYGFDFYEERFKEFLEGKIPSE